MVYKFGGFYQKCKYLQKLVNILKLFGKILDVEPEVSYRSVPKIIRLVIRAHI